VSYFIDNISVAPSATSAATAVPTMSGYALLGLGVLLAICAALVLGKRHVRRQESRS
jgi:hypothetical protein